MEKIRFSLLFFLIYVLQLPAQYKLTVFVKYPFYYSEPDSSCNSCQKLDSIVRDLKVEAEITGLNGKYKKLVATTNCEGYANFVFTNWENNDKVHLSEIENIELNFPSVQVAEKSLGTPVLQSVNTSDKVKSQEDTILFTLSGGSPILREFGIATRPIQYYYPSFRFAVIADPHIGEEFNDFPGAGYAGHYPFENEPSHEYLYNVQRVIEAVNMWEVDFVFILGDITNSAEWSEFQKATSMFEELNAPYIPVFGNHDTWPYWNEHVWPCPHGGEEQDPSLLTIGEWFYQHFVSQYNSLRDLYLPNFSEHENLRSPGPCGQEYDSRYFNFAFDWQRIRFIVTDFNSRAPGAGSCNGTEGNADVYKGYPWDHSWDWLQTNLSDLANNHPDRNFLIINHHPLYNSSPVCFSAHEIHQISDAGLLNNPQERGWIGGHVHDNTVEPQPDITYYGDDIVAHVYAVKHAFAGNYAIFTIYDDFKLDFNCRLDPSGEHYNFEGTVRGRSAPVSSYTFNLGGVVVSGTGDIEETHRYNFKSRPCTRIKKVTLDAVIEGRHYIIAKPFRILANGLAPKNELVNRPITYQAADSINVAGKDKGLDTWFIIENGGDVTMEAGNCIRLRPGFEARNSCEFSASINPSLKSYSPSLSSSKTDNLSLSIPKSIESEKKDAAQTSSEKKITEPIPTVFSCTQNKPNPFVRSTTIKYGLPKNCDNVNLTVFNIAGQAVRTLVNGQESAGFKSVRWDGKNSAGTQVPQGIYFYVFKAGDFENHHKMILLR